MPTILEELARERELATALATNCAGRPTSREEILKGVDTVQPTATQRMMTPLLYRVIVELEPISELQEGSTILTKPVDVIRREEQSRCRGRIVAKGPYAFCNHPNGQPEIGDFVLFAQFAGDFVKDAATGKDYRVIDDLEVKAIIPQTADKVSVGL